ncbi:hypothetical protein BDY24DRAFT_371918 [Mrakia frigida]|uniref:pentatricopeptide repeat-containing protein n=1 Tax=Mrakia frigida TaxID=29902 RepID=UPI003FCC00F6
MSRKPQRISPRSMGTGTMKPVLNPNLSLKSKLPSFLESSKSPVQEPPPFKFTRLTSSSSSLSPLPKHGPAGFPPTQSALLAPKAQNEQEPITEPLRKAVSMDPAARKKLFVEQDRRNKIIFDFQPRGQPVAPAYFHSIIDSLLSPNSSSSSPLPPDALEVVRPLLARVPTFFNTTFSEPSAEAKALSSRLFSFTSTLEEAMEITAFFFQTSPPAQYTSKQVYYLAMNTLLFTVLEIKPRPPPTSLINFMKSFPEQTSILASRDHPLSKLLEIYNRRFAMEESRLCKGSEEQKREAKELRVSHLLVVRELHEAMKGVKHPIRSVRAFTSLMDGYSRAEGFDEAFEVWEEMRQKGGVGIDERAVSVFFDLCGFAGKPSLALSFRASLDNDKITLNMNHWNGYHECLTRCGNWIDVVASQADQVARHKLDPEKNPPLLPESVAAALRFASKLSRFQSCTTGKVLGSEDFEKLEDGLKGLMNEEEWKKVDALRSVLHLRPLPGIKSGVGRKVR